jgi:hypothetical protein
VSTLRNLTAAGLLLAATGSVQADLLKPVQAHSIDLAGSAGTAYYTVEPDGFHLVATLAYAESVEPLRVQAMLASGQSVTFSAPGTVGTEPDTLEFSRQDDRVIVRRRPSPD